jgi:hypothetical protein
MTYSILISSKHLQSALEAIAIIAIMIALGAPRIWAAGYKSIEHQFTRLSVRRWRAIVIAAAFPMATRLILLPLFPVPRPYVHDEFSYLLMADTFAHGRLANPVPPEWKHFETEYVLMQPTYASQYQPAQGLVLAAGQLLTGRPWWGVWASIGLMCGTLCWALGYVFRTNWALFGALVAALQFGIFGFWMNSYFGGAVAATGGALVAGSLLRMKAKPASSAALGAFGLCILLASRPFEGLIWSAAAALWITLQYRSLLREMIIPAVAVLAAGAISLAYYNGRVTGDHFNPPYAQARRTYGTPQSYWWQPAITVAHFNNPQVRDNYLNQRTYWNRRNSPAALMDSTWRRLRDFWRFFIGPLLTPALLFIVISWRDRRIRPWLFISAPFIAEHATYHAWYPQQSASETILILIILIQCWRHLRVSQRLRGWGMAMSRTLMTGYLVCVILISAGRAAESRLPHRVRDVWASLLPAPRARDRVLDFLERVPGKHLVFVHYGPKHPYIDEWVFNTADLTGSKVVFSRMIDPESDLELSRKLDDRRVWIADAGSGILRQVESRSVVTRMTESWAGSSRMNGTSKPSLGRPGDTMSPVKGLKE